MNAPQVSVIIPAYNAAQFMAETLAGVFAQTFSDYEVIVVNDGSPDTLKLDQVLEPFLDRITYLKQKNSGPAGARNHGLRVAKGEFIAFLDGDDAWPPDYLDAMMNMFQQQPSLDLVYADGELFGNSSLPRDRFMQTSKPPTDLVGLLTEGSQFIPSGTVLRKNIVVDAGCFDESLRGPEDYDLWLRLAYRGARIAFQPKALFRRRVHPGALTANERKMLAALVRVFEKLRDSAQLAPEAQLALEAQLARTTGEFGLVEGKAALKQNDPVRASEHLQKAHAYYGSKKLRLVLLGLRFAPRLTCRLAGAVQRSDLRPAGRAAAHQSD